MYQPTLGRWLSRDPIGVLGQSEIVYSHAYVANRLRGQLRPVVSEANGNVYAYVGNRPTNAIDPSGLADLKLNVTKPDSMPWSSGTLPGKFATTGYSERISVRYQTNKTKTMFRFKFTMEVKLSIILDLKNISKFKSKKQFKGLSRATAYGHEQKHVGNMIMIEMDAQAELTKAEATTYKTLAEAQKAVQKTFRDVKKRLDIRRKLEQNHGGKKPKSPGKYEFVQPLGTMPAKPTNAPKKNTQLDRDTQVVAAFDPCYTVLSTDFDTLWDPWP